MHINAAIPRLRSSSWANFLTVYREPMVTYQIKPDKTVKNWHIEVITRAMADLYTSFPKRFKVKAWQVTYKVQEAVGFDIVMTPAEIAFYVTVPQCRWAMVHQKLETVWPKATFSLAQIPTLPRKGTRCAEMLLAKHNFYSLKIARNDNDPLNNMLQAVKDLRDKDLARVSMLSTPVSRSIWEHAALAAFEKHRDGADLSRIDLSGMGLMKLAARVVDSLFNEVHETIGMFMFSESDRKKQVNIRKVANRSKELHEATMGKMSQPVFRTDVRLAVYSQDENRSETAIRSLANSFKDLNLDNEFIRRDIAYNGANQFLDRMERFVGPKITINYNILGSVELAKLMQLPGAELQEQFPEIAQIGRRETNIPAALLRGGIEIGEATYKGLKTKVYWPVDNHDELCLGRVFIGKQGSGKSTTASNFAVGAIERNFSVFVHDVADGKLCDDVRDGLPKDFPKDHIIELDFGDLQHPIGLDWYDSAKRSTGNVANRISSELALFLERFTDETGGRTRRWLKKAAQAVYSLPDSSLLDVLLMLCSKDFRKRIYPRLGDGLIKQAWQTFDRMSEAAQNQIVQPVLNRIDYLLDDDAMKNVLCQQPNADLDFRKWADGDTKPYCVLIRVPKAVLGATATDTLMTFLNTKLWMAILTRQNIPLPARRPCFSIYDEPHQFPGVTARAREQFAEGRKWRFGQVWCFHHWEQIDRQLGHIIQATGPHFMLFSTSKHTWESLENEIDPFTVQEALDIPRFYAIMCMFADNNRITPFLLKSCPPLPQQVNRADIRERCSQKYGRPVDEITRFIESKEAFFYS